MRLRTEPATGSGCIGALTHRALSQRALCSGTVTYQLTPLMLKGVSSAKSLPSRDSTLISQCASPLQVSCQDVDIARHRAGVLPALGRAGRRA